MRNVLESRVDAKIIGTVGVKASGTGKPQINVARECGPRIALNLARRRVCKGLAEDRYAVDLYIEKISSRKVTSPIKRIDCGEQNVHTDRGVLREVV